MMRAFKALGMMAAAAMLATGTAAAAATPAIAAPATEQVDDGSRLAGIDGTTLIEIGILAALVAIVLVATDGSSDDARPNSP